jgi:nitroreductase
VWLRGFDFAEVSSVFNLPKNHIPVMMFAMGYPSENTKPSPWHFERKPLEETVTVL